MKKIIAFLALSIILMNLSICFAIQSNDYVDSLFDESIANPIFFDDEQLTNLTKLYISFYKIYFELFCKMESDGWTIMPKEYNEYEYLMVLTESSGMYDEIDDGALRNIMMNEKINISLTMANLATICNRSILDLPSARDMILEDIARNSVFLQTAVY